MVCLIFTSTISCASLLLDVQLANFDIRNATESQGENLLASCKTSKLCWNNFVLCVISHKGGLHLYNHVIQRRTRSNWRSTVCMYYLFEQNICSVWRWQSLRHWVVYHFKMLDFFYTLFLYRALLLHVFMFVENFRTNLLCNVTWLFLLNARDISYTNTLLGQINNIKCETAVNVC